MAHQAQQLKPEFHNEQKPGLFSWIERVGNKLPNPFLMFVYLIVILMIVSAILSWMHISVVDPVKKEPVFVKNLLSKEGIQWLLPSIIQISPGLRR